MFMKKRKMRKTDVKGDFIYNNFILGMGYMKKIKIYFFISIVLILLGSLAAYFGVVGIFSPNLEKTIDNYIAKSVAEIIKQTEGLSPLDLTFFIMNNNIKTAFFGVVSGIYLAVFPIIIVIFNGYVLGFVAEKAVNSPVNTEGILVLWRLLPHGIFELPAILISIGLGIKLGLYPLYIKEKGKGLLSLIVAFLLFMLISGIIITLISFFVPGILDSEKRINDAVVFNNPLLSILFYLLIGMSFVVSFLIGLKILSNKDKTIFREIMWNTIRVFVFVVIPLLVIAGLIEGLLIFLVGQNR